MKRYLAGLMAGLFLLAGSRAATAAPIFADVPENHWAAEAVKALAQKGIIEGYPGPGEKSFNRPTVEKKRPVKAKAPRRKTPRR